MSEVVVRAMISTTITLDADGLELVKRIAEQLRLPTAEREGEQSIDVYQQVLDSIEARLHRRLAERVSAVYGSLAERIEKLQVNAIENVENSLSFLEEALKIAQGVVAADRAAEEGDEETLARLVDPKRRVLTQIVEENTPRGLHQIVPVHEDRARIDQLTHMRLR